MTESTDGIAIDDDTLALLAALKARLPEATGKAIIKTALGLTNTITGPQKQAMADERRMFRMPYYRKKYADAIKSTMDCMLQDKTKDAVFAYSMLARVKPTTLLQMIHQGMLFLCDNEDPTGEYKRLRGMIEVKKTPTAVIVRRKAVNDELVLQPQMVDSTVTDDHGWKAQLEEFIDSADEGTKLILKNQNLTQDEVKFIQEQIAMAPNIRGVVSNNSVKLLKLTEQQMRDLTTST